MNLDPDAPDDGRFNWWMTLEQAALALGVGTWHAYRLAREHRWRTCNTRPRGYSAADVRLTLIERRKQNL